MIEIGFSVWYLIGLYSFYYWYTEDADITLDGELIGMWLLMGSFGLLAWFIGRSIHKDRDTTIEDEAPIVLFKKRKPNNTKG
jgi:hypothetical protein